MWAEQGSNLRTRERTDLQSVAFNHSAICPIIKSFIGALLTKASRQEPTTC